MSRESQAYEHRINILRKVIVHLKESNRKQAVAIRLTACPECSGTVLSGHKDFCIKYRPESKHEAHQIEMKEREAFKNKVVEDLARHAKNKVDHVNNPSHYGGADNPYEAIKVLKAWGLLKSFNLGNVIKYIARADKKGATLEDLKKARWYLDYEIKDREESGKE